MLKKHTLAILIALFLTIGFVGQTPAHKGHAVILWEDTYDLYINCRQGQSVATTWYLLMDDPQPFFDAVDADEESFWAGDQHKNLYFNPTYHTYGVGPNKTLVVYKAHSNSNHMVFEWAGVKFGNPNTDTLSLYRVECNNQAPDAKHVLIPVAGD